MKWNCSERILDGLGIENVVCDVFVAIQETQIAFLNSYKGLPKRVKVRFEHSTGSFHIYIYWWCACVYFEF